VLTKLRLENFKSFRDATIDFAPSGLTVLVGPNGCGKTSVLEAVNELSSRLRPGTSPVHSLERLRRDANNYTLEGLLTLPGWASTAQAAVKFFFNNGRRHERILVRKSPTDPERALEDGILEDPRLPMIPPGQEQDSLYRELPSVRFVDIKPSELRRPLRPPDKAGSPFDAAQLIGALFELRMGADLGGFQQLVDQVKRVVPALRGVSVLRRPEGEKDYYSLEFDMATGQGIGASQVSEGTLISLSLLTAAALTSRPTILLIDDLDRGLHPVAQRELVKLLRKTVEVKPGLQIICTSHSPYILSEFGFDEVRVLREFNGGAEVKRLDDGPDAARWMKELDAGEYWSFIEHKLFAPTGT
jgi:predicted ATPase